MEPEIKDKTAFIYEKDQHGIVTVTMDMPGRSANVINDEFGFALRQTLDRLAGDEKVKGLVITSAKKTFLAGGDIDMLFAQNDPQKVFERSQNLKAGFRALETNGIPVVAAINGAALGGGFELALACHYRIAIDHQSTKFGFPEVTLGLLPGGGGITRAVRLLGIEAAQPYLMQGKQIDAVKALELGFIHELAKDQEKLMQKAHHWILSNPEPVQPWDKKGYRMPGGNPQHPKMAVRIPVMPAVVSKTTFNNYPAVQAILATIVEGAVVDFDTASRIESRYFAQVTTSQVAKNMISAFWYQRNAIAKGKSRPKDIPTQKTKVVGVLGAGLMGHGIAYVSAKAGIEVVLKDISKEKAATGKQKIAAIMDKRISRGQMSTDAKKTILDKIIPTGDAADLASCDLIIEAVFENRELKAKVTQEAEAFLAEETVFASNTSTLPISGLAKQSSRPTQFIGLHFFSPVDRMELVEIIVGKETSPATLAKAFDYVLAIRKTPIVVNDSRGFYTSRVFSSYTNEGMNLLAEGQHPRAIEMAGKKLGMPMGPLEVIDAVNLKTAFTIGEQTVKDQEAEGILVPERPGSKVLSLLVEEHSRWGKAQGAGFYDYDEKNRKTLLWPGLIELFPLNEKQLELQTMIDRLGFAQAIESVRCLEEKVLTSVADANLGSIFGWGFAPFQGGTLQFINAYGLDKFVKRARELAAAFGERFNPPQLLMDMAEKGEIFE